MNSIKNFSKKQKFHFHIVFNHTAEQLFDVEPCSEADAFVRLTCQIRTGDKDWIQEEIL